MADKKIKNETEEKVKNQNHEEETKTAEKEVQEEVKEKEEDTEDKTAADEVSDDKEPAEDSQAHVENLEKKLSELSDKHLRLQAEFDNFRRRTLKEKADLIKAGGETTIIMLLPVIDDFERALESLKEVPDDDAGKQGTTLIYTKFKDFLKQNNVKEIDALNQDFDVDLHEAVTKIPAPDKKHKGKVVDVIQKGYTLNDKVIRFAKVVVGE